MKKYRYLLFMTGACLGLLGGLNDTHAAQIATTKATGIESASPGSIMLASKDQRFGYNRHRPGDRHRHRPHYRHKPRHRHRPYYRPYYRWHHYPYRYRYHWDRYYWDPWWRYGYGPYFGWYGPYYGFSLTVPPPPVADGHYEIEKTWVPPVTKQVWVKDHQYTEKKWVDGHTDEQGNWVEGHYEQHSENVPGYWATVIDKPGYWEKKRIWVQH